MSDTINSDLIRGHIDTIILRILFEGDRYGYDIIKEIEQKAAGKYTIKQPTLYSSLKRLEEQGFTKSYWQPDGRKRYYTLTAMGKEVFLKSQTQWRKTQTILDCLIASGSAAEIADSKIEDGDFADKYSDNDLSDSDNLDDSFDNNNDSWAQEDERHPRFSLDSLNNQYGDDSPGLNSLFHEQNKTDNDDNDNDYLSAAASDNAQEGGDYSFWDDDSPAASPKPETETSENDVADGAFGFLQDDSPANNTADATETLTPETNGFFEPSPFEQFNVSNTYELDDAGEPVQVTFGAKQGEDVPDPGDAKNADAADNPILRRIDDIYSDIKDKQSYVENISRTSYAPPRPPVFKPTEQEKFEDDEIPYAELHDEPHPAPTQKDADEQPDVSADFLSYQTPIVKEKTSRDSEIIERQYQTALTKLVRKDSADLNSRAKQQARLTEVQTAVREEMGDEVIIRPHNESVKEYNTEHYFYSNKLKLIQHGILFLIMLAQIAAMFFVCEMRLKDLADLGSRDKRLYMLGVLIALYLPAEAFISSILDIGRRKTRQFNLKTSLFFRIIIVLQFWVITLCVGVYMGLLGGDVLSYSARVFLPALLSVNVFISGVIFNLLLKSGKFNVKN